MKANNFSAIVFILWAVAVSSFFYLIYFLTTIKKRRDKKRKEKELEIAKEEREKIISRIDAIYPDIKKALELIKYKLKSNKRYFSGYDLYLLNPQITPTYDLIRAEFKSQMQLFGLTNL